MKRCSHTAFAFSLVEVTLALGVAGFCLIAVFGLLPVGVQTNQRSISQTAATGILAGVMADMRAAKSSAISAQYKITWGTATTLYFDGSGACSTNVNGSTKPDGTSWIPPLSVRYQLNVSFPNGALAYPATYATLRLSWPASATVANASGSCEMLAAFDRH